MVLMCPLLSISIINFAQTVVLSPVKDNTIFQDNPGNSNGIGGDIIAGNTAGSSPRRALIKFDIAGNVPAGVTITSVTLTLNCNKTPAGSPASNVRLFKLLKDWGEGNSNAGPGPTGDGAGVTASVNDATWICRNADGAGGCLISWNTAGGEFNASASATTPVGPALINYTWSGPQMVADAQSWKTTPASNFGWLIMGDESTFTTARGYGSRENSVITNRPKLSVTYVNPAPVTLVSFNASEISSGISLTWLTAAEYNNSYFSIERSTNGINFTPIARIDGVGTSTTPHSYQYIDRAVSMGQNFYRLVQTDVNGSPHYSNIVSILAKSKHLQLSISPNPVTNLLNIGSVINSNGLKYSIINAAGTTVKSGQLIGTRVMVSDIPAGFYMIRLVNPSGQTLSGIFLKQ